MCGVAIYSNRNDTYYYLWNISEGIADINEILHEYIMYTYISWFRFWIGKLCCCERCSKTQKWKGILGCHFEIHINHKITLCKFYALKNAGGDLLQTKWKYPDTSNNVEEIAQGVAKSLLYIADVR